MPDYYDQHPLSRWLALVSICIATFLVPLSMSAVNIALPAIADDLQADAVLISWVPTANLLGSVVLLLPTGRVADIVGRKKIYQLGVLAFSVTSLMVLWLSSIEALLLIRVLQGLASAMVFGTGMAIISAVFANANRGMALGLASTSVYLGLTCGPLIGGWLTELISWRAVFWAPVPFALLALVLVALNVKEVCGKQKHERLDWLGSILFALASSSLFFGLAGLPEPENITLTLVGIFLFYLFVQQQSVAAFPLIRFKALADNRIFTRSLIACLFMFAAHYPLLFLLSLYLQYIQGMSPTESGQLILLQALVMAIISPFAGRLSDRYEPRLIATAGCLLFASGFFTLFWLDNDSTLIMVVTGLLLLGVGFGMFSSPNNNAAMGSVRPDRLSIASALINLARTMGNMISMSIVVLLFNLFIGQETLTPEQFPSLLLVLKICMALGLIYTLLAAYSSYSRGKVLKANQ